MVKRHYYQKFIAIIKQQQFIIAKTYRFVLVDVRSQVIEAFATIIGVASIIEVEPSFTG